MADKHHLATNLGNQEKLPSRIIANRPRPKYCPLVSKDNQPHLSQANLDKSSLILLLGDVIHKVSFRPNEHP